MLSLQEVHQNVKMRAFIIFTVLLTSRITLLVLWAALRVSGAQQVEVLALYTAWTPQVTLWSPEKGGRRAILWSQVYCVVPAPLSQITPNWRSEGVIDTSVIPALGRWQEKNHSKFKVPGCSKLADANYTRLSQKVSANQRKQDMPTKSSYSYLNGNTNVYHVWISRKDCCI